VSHTMSCCCCCCCLLHHISQVYLEACFREALRLHPAVAVVTRDVYADTTLKGEEAHSSDLRTRSLALSVNGCIAAVTHPDM
jgi:hypothetical protein